MPSQILDLKVGATKSFSNTLNHTHTHSYPYTEQSFLWTKFLMLLLTVASFSSEPIRVLLNVVPNLDCFENSFICIKYMILITNSTSLPSYPKRIGCLYFVLTPRWCCMKIGNWNELKIEKTHNPQPHNTRNTYTNRFRPWWFALEPLHLGPAPPEPVRGAQGTPSAHARHWQYLWCPRPRQCWVPLQASR